MFGQTVGGKGPVGRAAITDIIGAGMGITKYGEVMKNTIIDEIRASLDSRQPATEFMWWRKYAPVRIYDGWDLWGGDWILEIARLDRIQDLWADYEHFD